MNHKIRASLGVLALLLLAGAAWQWRTADTPAGQPPLVELTEANLAQLRNTFNHDTDRIRIVLLLSPT
ncbi:MAG: hypothetical protein ACRD2Q_02385 [Terriglobales bacterium]